ncbi:MAG TPA: hypothetical protein ENK06_08790 [Gammaproteobacteria bacterium]|nr:hypothetical protein [Gammaproteobacteria bacterium]
MPNTHLINVPRDFLPNGSQEMRQALWQKLAAENTTIHEALMQFLSRTINTPIEQEVAEMIADGFEEYWETYLAANRIKNAISASKLCRRA